MSFTLKLYQQRAIDALGNFFSQLASGKSLHEVWHQQPFQEEYRARGEPLLPYQDAAFGETPCVCMRLPTGGGKTLLASHVIGTLSEKFLFTETPVALWLVPSDAIREQTLAALKNLRHPYRQALDERFNNKVRVCDLESLITVGPHEVGTHAIIIVATIQAFRVEETSKRNVYAFDEALSPHFQHVTLQQHNDLEVVTEKDLASQPYLTSNDLGRIKTSLANWLHVQRPIVIVDEAHNSRTDKSFNTLKRLNPSAIIELTATPLKGSNVLYHVSAQELKNEEMIKLPIMLVEHITGWQDAVRDAILTQRRLELLAQKEPDYVRPIVLFQAEPKGGDVTVEVLETHLKNVEKLPENQIAVATGTQKDLDGIDLLDTQCPIRFVITVEALKEGWDCSFAYVLCSMQESRSAKDVEQLLGRVLRMPYAKSRQSPDLNQAYAHITTRSFGSAMHSIQDNLVNNMGFDLMDAAMAVHQLPTQPALNNLQTSSASGSATQSTPLMSISMPVMPNMAVPTHLQTQIEVRPTMSGATAIIRGSTLTPEAEDFILTAVPKKHQAAVQQRIEQEKARVESETSPSARGVPFAQMPLLCWRDNGEPYLIDRELLDEITNFSLLDDPIALPHFSINEKAKSWYLDMQQGHLRSGFLSGEQLHLDGVASNITENDLICWLDAQLRQPYFYQNDIQGYLSRMLRYLQQDRAFTLTALVRGKFQLVEALKRDIEQRRENAGKRGFQQELSMMMAATPEDGMDFHFSFKPGYYAGRPPYYKGSFQFKHHYFGNAQIHDLREKTEKGKYSEEFLCAQAIDTHPQIKHWVRNVEREPRLSFKLPVSSGYFYPDFVCELNDGRLLVIEYKGEHLQDNADSREKSAVGAQWEKTSGGRCLFLMATKNENGADVTSQLQSKINKGA